jgi:hypothetical protein
VKVSVNETAARRLAADGVTYLERPMSCAGVRAAYRHWSSAPKTDTDLALVADAPAIDREEPSAGAYSQAKQRRL